MKLFIYSPNSNFSTLSESKTFLNACFLKLHNIQTPADQWYSYRIHIHLLILDNLYPYLYWHSYLDISSMRLSKNLKKLLFVCLIFCGILIFRDFFSSYVKPTRVSHIFSNKRLEDFDSGLPAIVLGSKSTECPAGARAANTFWGLMCWDESRHLFTTPRGEAFIWTFIEDSSRSFDSVRESLASIECNNGRVLRLVVLNESTAHSLPNVKHDFSLLTSRHKAIYIRQLVLHEFGGVYVELHVVAFREMDALLKKLREYDLVQLHPESSTGTGTGGGCVLGTGPARAQTQLTHSWLTAIEQLIDTHHEALVRANTAGSLDRAFTSTFFDSIRTDSISNI